MAEGLGETVVERAAEVCPLEPVLHEADEGVGEVSLVLCRTRLRWRELIGGEDSAGLNLSWRHRLNGLGFNRLAPHLGHDVGRRIWQSLRNLAVDFFPCRAGDVPHGVVLEGNLDDLAPLPRGWEAARMGAAHLPRLAVFGQHDVSVQPERVRVAADRGDLERLVRRHRGPGLSCSNSTG
ncbi:MAG: hypothetical protein K8U57_27905 [Planctomycetes bacterium]|nr:hypothetical protein [Planctomycetota bacterium]